MGGSGGGFHRRTTPQEMKQMYAQALQHTQSVVYQSVIADKIR